MTTDAPSRRGSMFIASLALAVFAAAPTPALAARVTEINEAIRKGELTKLPGLTHADADRIKKLQKYQAPQPGSQPQTEYLTKIDLVNRGALSQATYDAIKNKITVLANDTDPKCRATLREPYRDDPPEEALDNMRLEAKNITRISYFWPASFFWSLGPGKPPRATAARVRVDQIYGDPNEFVPNFYNFMNPNVLVPHLANTRRTQGEFFERIPEAVHSPKDFQRGDVVLFGGHTSIVAVAGTEATVVLSHLDFDRIEQECYALTKTRTGRSQEDSYVVTRDRLADLRDPTIRALMSTIFVKPYVLYRLRPNRAQMVGWDETELPSRVHRPR